MQNIINSRNELAIKVKMADTNDNLSRVNELPEEMRSIGKRYEQTVRMFADAGY